jgi:hypothetical protein
MVRTFLIDPKTCPHGRSASCGTHRLATERSRPDEDATSSVVPSCPAACGDDQRHFSSRSNMSAHSHRAEVIEI